MTEPISAWESIIKQGPLFAFMALALYFLIKFVDRLLTQQQQRENEREARYNALIDATLKTSKEQTETVVASLIGNTQVLQRVERKLNDQSHD